MELTSKRSVVLTTENLPKPLQLKLKLGDITEQPDGSALLDVEIDWTNLQEVLQDFILTALEAGIERPEK